MKTISTAVLLMTVLTGMAQLPAENRVTYKSLVGQTAPLRESVIWQETFESGIPGDWTNSETGGIAYWEYRGPDTTPSNNVGTRGSCLPEGTLGAPIQSPTAGDGFVIFDSNWWDDPIGPCGNLGSGDAPAPHLAILQTPSFDLSAYDKVGFSFYQYAKDYDVDMRVEVSISGGAWTDVWTENMIVNAETPKDQLVRINITDEAALQSDVRIRFVFDGQYYFWMIDDVALLELDENNLHIFRPGYGDFDFDAPDHPTGFEEMEYGLYPDEFAPELKFSAWASNYGAAVQTDVGLHAEVIRDADGVMIHDSNSSETFNLQPTGETLLRAGSFQMPETLGWYSIAYQAYQNETEESPEDNHDTLHFAITDITYARDKGPVEGVIIPQDDLSSLPYEIGNIYVATAGGTQAHSVSAAISIGTSVGAEVYARLYEFAVDTTIEANLIATSDPITVTSAMLNDANDLVLTHFIFDSPINLQNGYSYLATIACDEGADQMLVGSNGDANEFSSWVLFESDQWFYLTHVPIVRLNIGDITSVAEGENKPALQLFPNPADGYFVLSGATIGSNYSIYDAQGKMMKQGVVKNTVTRIETSDLSPGMYVLRNETNSLHLNVIH